MDDKPASLADVLRIEAQIAKLTEAVTQLARMDERLKAADERTTAMERRQEAHDAELRALRDEVSRWVNRGLGLWGALMALWAVAQTGAAQALIGSAT